MARFTCVAQKDLILLIRVDAPPHSNCGHEMTILRFSKMLFLRPSATVGRKLMSFWRVHPKFSLQFVIASVGTSPCDLYLMLYSFQCVTFLEITIFRYRKKYHLLSTVSSIEIYDALQKEESVCFVKL